MNKCRRKKTSNHWTIKKAFKISEKDNQTVISKLLVKQQENKKSNCRLPEVSQPLLNNDSVISCCTNLPSPIRITMKVPSEYKENCIKSNKDFDVCTQDASNINSISDKSKNSIKEKKNKKQMLSQNRLLTDYFPVRRSSRKTLSNTKKERQNMVENAILSGKEEGFEIKEFPGKGRGVITKKPIKRGEFVLEYYGELIDYEEAKKRETIYATIENTGCYMYYFKFRNKRFCIDATKETNRLGRLVNHSKKGNLKTQPFFVKERPHLVLLACRDIEPGEELSYDYGDRRKVAVESHPWLAL